MPDLILSPVASKTCTKCGEVKPATSDLFFKSRGGLKASCKSCSSIQAKSRNDKNKKPSQFDYTGRIFGRLTAIEKVRSDAGKAVWRYLCDCGNTVEKPAISVNYGSISSCGCLRTEFAKSKAKNLDGMRFGRLLVESYSHSDSNKKRIYKCICSCGNSAHVGSGSLLKPNGTKSCGCLQRESVADRQRAKALPPEIKTQRVKQSRAKQRAKRKSNPIAVMSARLSRLHRHALKQVGAIKESATFDMLGYSVDTFVKHIERQFVSGMGWSNMKDWQIDHIIPISQAKTIDDVVALNQLSNLQPLWSKENNQKKNKVLNLL